MAFWNGNSIVMTSSHTNIKVRYPFTVFVFFIPSSCHCLSLHSKTRAPLTIKQMATTFIPIHNPKNSSKSMMSLPNSRRLVLKNLYY